MPVTQNIGGLKVALEMRSFQHGLFHTGCKGDDIIQHIYASQLKHEDD